MDRFAHCGGCGTKFAAGVTWPRTCAQCGLESYRNPIPVAVAMIPVGGGLLVIRRSIPPQVGKLALPGGFVNYGETWQDGAAREVKEETGLAIDAARIEHFRTVSAPDGNLIIFGTAPSLGNAIPLFVANEETSELSVITEPVELAFSLHTEAARDWFRLRR